MTKPPEPRSEQRIAKLLARAGIASRREIERMIAEGRIALNGETVTTPATLLKSLHGVTVDGNPVKAAAPARLFRFHKPAGVLTTERDPKGRKTIYDLLPRDLPRVMPVGRLDYNTEGLLLLTTDGALKRQLELPSTGLERSYRARAFGEISQEQLEELIHGIEIEGIRYGAIDANLERRTGRNQWIEMRLKEGKNREVRRVLEHFGLEVNRLIRTAYGPFPLADLPVGAVDEIRQHDLITFRNSLSGSRAQSIEAEPAPSPAGRPVRSSRPARPARPSVPKPADRPARPPRPQRRDKTVDRDALVDRPRRSPATAPKEAVLAAEASADKPKRLKRGAGWAKPKVSSRPTPRGGGGKRHPTRGRPGGGKK